MKEALRETQTLRAHRL